MTSTDNHEILAEQVRRELDSTPYKSKSLTRLSGGVGNFVYHNALATPLPDGTKEVVVKHGEGYVASSPDFQLATTRCRIEETCLRQLSALSRFTSSMYTVATPELYYFNQETNTQILEYLPNATNLKAYALENWGAPTGPTTKTQCYELGRSLGVWLRSFHAWSNGPEQSSLRETVAGNEAMQSMKYTINYRGTLQRINRHPSILGGSKEVFEKVAAMAEAELTDSSQLRVIHGDFWTGNVILPSQPINASAPTQMLILDWELAQLGILALDLAQMIAEMYLLKLFKNIEAGVWMIQGFVAGYGDIDEADAFRTAIHIGTHIIWIGGGTLAGWGDARQMEEAVAMGRDIVVKAWEKDKDWFLDNDLSCLFAQPASM